MKSVLGAVLLSALAVTPAKALCIYNGVENARTTVAQEFKDARWVVRAHVISADYHWSDEGDAWTTYRLKVVETYKGHLPARFTFFTSRDSGGFYMDKTGADPDFDQDYLLFLVPYPYNRANPHVAKGALWVNYACGQSKGWSQVTAADKTELMRLIARR